MDTPTILSSLASPLGSVRSSLVRLLPVGLQALSAVKEEDHRVSAAIQISILQELATVLISGLEMASGEDSQHYEYIQLCFMHYSTTSSRPLFSRHNEDSRQSHLLLVFPADSGFSPGSPPSFNCFPAPRLHRQYSSTSVAFLSFAACSMSEPPRRALLRTLRVDERPNYNEQSDTSSHFRLVMSTIFHISRRRKLPQFRSYGPLFNTDSSFTSSLFWFKQLTTFTEQAVCCTCDRVTSSANASQRIINFRKSIVEAVPKGLSKAKLCSVLSDGSERRLIPSVPTSSEMLY
ncbi:hypothetical protein BDP27DRAFT_1427633 [Rhodocollybia butyracea]|uniref:Uncharacterized protein n=1 Tax=Rhodocollybia butyracea TaxID=206335 RepID=A0A9P5PG16_9AGAR|nr:hypothetical protein BDP27DRAFT_1427633 [Rhodocollybia butyracea]